MRFACSLSCLKLCEIEITVFLALPEFVALMRVFIIKSLYFVGCWGRRLASVCVIKSLCIIIPQHLEWFRIPAWGVGDPGFKSQRPHHKINLQASTYFGTRNDKRSAVYAPYFFRATT